MNATVTDCSLDWLWAVGDRVGKDPKGYFPVPNRKGRDLERVNKEQIPRRSAPRNDKGVGSSDKVEAFCGREPECSEGGSPQPKSRATRGNSSLPYPNFTKRRGEYGEAAFLTKAASMGSGVAKSRW